MWYITTKWLFEMEDAGPPFLIAFVTFEDNNIKNIILNRMAYTMYHAIDSSLLIGINAVDGDLITLDFQDDQLYQINVKGDARGLFTPEPNNSQIDSAITYKSSEIDYL